MTDLRAILLDFDGRHQLLESRIGPRFQHLTNRNTYLVDVQNAMRVSRRIDLFLSAADRNIIGNDVPLFDKVHFHLYCPTINDVPNNQALFPSQSYVQVFEEDTLWVHISRAILGHDLTRLMENYSTQALAIYQETNRIVLEEVEAAKLGVQPE